MKKKGAKRYFDPHIRLYWWFCKSEAWRSLRPAERAVLIELYGLYNGRNNGDLFLSVREAAERTRVNKDTAAAAFWTLQERGFIQAKTRGYFNLKEAPQNRRATSWILTEFECGQRPPSKEFLRWRAGMSFEQRPPQ